MRVVSVWQTTDEDYGKAGARWSICPLLRGRNATCKAQMQQMCHNCNIVLRCRQVRLAEATPRSFGNATQPHATRRSPRAAPRKARNATVATPDLCTQPHASPRSSHAAHAKVATVATPDLCTQPQRIAKKRHKVPAKRLAIARHDLGHMS